MVNKVVEGIIDSKIQDGRCFKGIQQNSPIIHLRVIIVDVWYLMLFSGPRNSFKLLIRLQREMAKIPKSDQSRNTSRNYTSEK